MDDKTVFADLDLGDYRNGGPAGIRGPEELDSLYMELGKAYYEGAFEDPLPQLLPLFDQITKIKNRGREAVQFCPQCGSKLENDAVFCGKCGCKIR